MLDPEPLRCSFCGKTEDQIRKLVFGPGVYICNECVSLCVEIIKDEFPEEFPALLRGPPSPDLDR